MKLVVVGSCAEGNEKENTSICFFSRTGFTQSSALEQKDFVVFFKPYYLINYINFLLTILGK